MYTITIEKRYGKELADAAKFFREISESIDQDPNNIMQFTDQPALKMLRDDDSSNCLAKAKMYEALAYGDAGSLFASPRPCLSGLLLREIGNEKQYRKFHTAVREKAMRTCFAVTEKNVGSDASQIEATLSFNKAEGLWKLNGQKWLFGNGICADIGVVWARTSPGPLGIRGAIVRFSEKATLENIYRNSLPMLGLRGASLSSIIFKDFPVDPDDLIGEHLSPMKVGMLALVRTFNRMRICIVALAIGQAQAICDYIVTTRVNLSQKDSDLISSYQNRLDSIRFKTFEIAPELDQNPDQTAKVSLLKALATTLLEEIVGNMFAFFGQGAFFEHPFLAKSYRDAFAYEYTDGTIHIQRNNIFQGYRDGRLGRSILENGGTE